MDIVNAIVWKPLFRVFRASAGARPATLSPTAPLTVECLEERCGPCDLSGLGGAILLPPAPFVPLAALAVASPGPAQADPWEPEALAWLHLSSCAPAAEPEETTVGGQPGSGAVPLPTTLFAAPWQPFAENGFNLVPGFFGADVLTGLVEPADLAQPPFPQRSSALPNLPTVPRGAAQTGAGAHAPITGNPRATGAVRPAAPATQLPTAATSQAPAADSAPDFAEPPFTGHFTLADMDPGAAEPEVAEKVETPEETGADPEPSPMPAPSEPEPDPWISGIFVAQRQPTESKTETVAMQPEPTAQPPLGSSGSLRQPQQPVVASSIVTVPFLTNGAATDLKNRAFRVSRAPASEAPLTVHYTLNACTSAGVIQQAGAAVIAADAGHCDVPALGRMVAAAPAEAVVLQLQEHRSYRLGTRCATLFAGQPSASFSEAALFEAYRYGQSGEAFRALVERHHGTVYQTCYQLLGNRHDAEDVTQAVFLTLAQRQLRLQSTLVGWLRTVARNAAISFIRARRRRARHEQEVAQPDLFFGGEELPELREELDTALSQVAAPLREAVRLRYLEGWSQHEAASLVGCPRGTLAQRAAKGIGQLRAVLTCRGTLCE